MGKNLEAYIIKKNNYGACEDTIMTKYHAILLNKKLIFSKDLDKKTIDKFIPYDDETYTFYHIVLSDKRLDTMIANGIITEGYGEREIKYGPKTRNKDKLFVDQF